VNRDDILRGSFEHAGRVADQMFKADINMLRRAGLRDQVIVMVGGAPITEENADAGGADGDAADAAVRYGRFHDVELLDHFTGSR
jgi:hypothetical protein